MIRQAETKDLPQIVDLGEEFANKTIHGQKVPFDRESFTNLCIGLICNTDNALYVDDKVKGMTAGMIFPAMFNQNFMVGSELWVYSRTAGLGIKLLKILEAWARNQGAVILTLSGQSNLKDVSRLYRRMGYEPTENLYTKDL